MTVNDCVFILYLGARKCRKRAILLPANLEEAGVFRTQSLTPHTLSLVELL